MSSATGRRLLAQLAEKALRQAELYTIFTAQQSMLAAQHSMFTTQLKTVLQQVDRREKQIQEEMQDMQEALSRSLSGTSSQHHSSNQGNSAELTAANLPTSGACSILRSPPTTLPPT